MGTISRKGTMIAWVILTIINLLVVVGAILAVFTMRPGETVRTPIGEVTKPLKRLSRLFKDTDGKVIAEYTDGSKDIIKLETAQAIKGDTGSKGDKGDKGEAGATGKDGANGKDGYSPTKSDILAAVKEYCATRNQCIGETGARGDKGDKGDSGVNGKDGKGGDLVRCTVVDSDTVEIEIKPAGYTSWLTLAQVKGRC